MICVFCHTLEFVISLYKACSFLLAQLQTPASFAQSVQELTIALQRTGDPANLNRLRPHLELLANIDPSPGEKQLQESLFCIDIRMQCHKLESTQ